MTEGRTPSPDEDGFEGMYARMCREHPWLMRRARLRTARHAWVGRHLPWLCRHTSSTGPAGGDVGWCMDCGKELDWKEKSDA